MFHSRCCYCGRFCIPVDWEAPYGSGDEVDPPEDEPICEKCNTRLVAMAIQDPARVATLAGGTWHKPNYMRIAESIVRHSKRLLNNAR